MNVAEYLIKKLEDIGLTDFFGLPGDYNFNILNAINSNSQTNWIGCTNELNAGYAADGYARQKGFGAVVTTYGVGELSVTNAIAGSYAENVPVIHIVGTPSLKVLNSGKIIHHGFSNPKPYEFIEAAKHITEACVFLNRDNARIEIDRVLKIFVKERRPVYIAIPTDVALLEIPYRNIDYDWISDDTVLKNVINSAINKIENSQKPVILGDTLIKRFNAKDEYISFVEKSGIPVTNFLMGANIVSYNHPNNVGTHCGKYSNPAAKKLLDETDCLISIGTIYGDMNSFGTKLNKDINSDIAIYGTFTYVDGKKYENVKMADVLIGLTKVIEHKKYNIEKHNYEYRPVVPKKEQLTSDYLYPRLQEFLKNDDILITETGVIPYGFAQMKYPEKAEIHSQLLWCSIGWATPAAFGVCIANPNARVILITGEGAHQISAMGIGNMCKNGIKPIIIVLNNNGYTIERYLSGDPENKFNDVMQLDYSKFARSFEGDVWAAKVDTDDDFDKALRVTQIMDKLCYIEAVLPQMDIPELAKRVFENIEINTKISDSENENKELPDKKDSSKEETTFKEAEEPEFKTSVHKSLKEF